MKFKHTYLREIAVPKLCVPRALIEMPERFLSEASEPEIEVFLTSINGVKVALHGEELIAVEKLELLRALKDRWPDLKIRVAIVKHVDNEADCVELISRLATIDALSTISPKMLPTFNRRNKTRGAQDLIKTTAWSSIVDTDYSTLFHQAKHFID